MRRKNHELTFYKKEKKIKPHHFKGLLYLLFWMAAVSFIAFVIVLIFGTRTSVIGEGMQPTYFNSQEVLINKAAYIVLSPKRGDVIAFYPNGNSKSHAYVKRVVAVPGDKVQIVNGHLNINGILYEDEDKYDNMVYSGLAENEIILGDEEYFVLGDNRNNSEDSRNGNIGPVKSDNIVGKVWFHLSCEESSMGFN